MASMAVDPESVHERTPEQRRYRIAFLTWARWYFRVYDENRAIALTRGSPYQPEPPGRGCSHPKIERHRETAEHPDVLACKSCEMWIPVDVLDQLTSEGALR